MSCQCRVPNLHPAASAWGQEAGTGGKAGGQAASHSARAQLTVLRLYHPSLQFCSQRSDLLVWQDSLFESLNL